MPEQELTGSPFDLESWVAEINQQVAELNRARGFGIAQYYINRSLPEPDDNSRSSVLFEDSGNSNHLSIKHRDGTLVDLEAIITGPQGAQGPPGSPGEDGPEGPQGSQGVTGPQGAFGNPGATGPTGPQGTQGPPGRDGDDGAQGEPGPTGPIGPIGPTGNTGSTGSAGAQGIQGVQGPPGNDGRDGVDGEMGPPGPSGSGSSASVPKRQLKIRAESLAVVGTSTEADSTGMTVWEGTDGTITFKSVMNFQTPPTNAVSQTWKVFKNGSVAATITFTGDGATLRFTSSTSITLTQGDRVALSHTAGDTSASRAECTLVEQ